MVIPQQISSKIRSISEAKTQIKIWKKEGKVIVFTNGVFDIQHPGHVTYLQNALEHGDKLVIGLNNDQSVKSLNKAADRPINDEFSRAIMLAALESTSLIVLFPESTPLNLIKELMPDILVKGGDYDENANEGDPRYIVGSQEVNANGGKTKCIDFLPGYSSTSIINKIKGIDG